MKKYTKRYKFIKFISALIIISGIIRIYGTAGSSDLGLIKINEIITQCIIGFFVIVIGSSIWIFNNVSYKNRKKKYYRNIKFQNSYKRFVCRMCKLDN